LEGEEFDSTKEHKSKGEEPLTPVLRGYVWERSKLERYSPPDFHSNFALSITDDDPITVHEAVDSKDGKLWRKIWLKKWFPWIKMRLGI
jgi:hypothetical protein